MPDLRAVANAAGDSARNDHSHTHEPLSVYHETTRRFFDATTLHRCAFLSGPCVEHLEHNGTSAFRNGAMTDP